MNLKSTQPHAVVLQHNYSCIIMIYLIYTFILNKLNFIVFYYILSVIFHTVVSKLFFTTRKNISHCR